ncbi:MAG: hypothetical protein HXY20_12810 [Acidobacteria bacterium]|nr:hypothetical protein [Acidobacteriota bacterium]
MIRRLSRLLEVIAKLIDHVGVQVLAEPGVAGWRIDLNGVFCDGYPATLLCTRGTWTQGTDKFPAFFVSME